MESKNDLTDVVNNDGIRINSTVLRILCTEFKGGEVKVADECGLDVDVIQDWIHENKLPSSIEFDTLCDVLCVSPDLLLLDSNDIITLGKETRVVRFYVLELLGKHKDPTATEVEKIEAQIRVEQEIKDSGTEVRPGVFAIYDTEESSTDSESSTIRSDEVHGS